MTDVVAFFIQDPESSLLEQAGEDPFDDAAVPCQSASICEMSPYYFRDDSPLPQRSSYSALAS